MKYKVVTKGNENEVLATGFYGSIGFDIATRRIKEGYFYAHMYIEDRHKQLIIIEDKFKL
jgi:hypothetical protein